jgi:hypothetical protein
MKTETWEQKEFNGIAAGIDVGYIFLKVLYNL